MTCLDCAALDDRDKPAVGLCRDCGAGVCLAHAHLAHIPGHQPGLTGSKPMTRRLYCGFCASTHPGVRPATQPDVVIAKPCAHPTCLC